VTFSSLKNNRAGILTGRIVVLGLVPLLLAACNTSQSVSRNGLVMNSSGATVAAPAVAPVTPVEVSQPEDADLRDYSAMYAAVSDNGKTIPAIDISKVDKRNLRQEVNYRTTHPVGTVIVDPYKRYLYLVMPNDRAMRYAVGVGKAGMAFSGTADIARKASWPRWTPTQNMIKRSPEQYSKYAGGVEGGVTNPLGARALYLHRNGEDTLYRIHGTNQPWTIGKAASSGCIRLFNQDILDLHKRVPTGSKVVVLNQQESGKGEF
jgi:lipoprotein-anchoring transpeptidase ErfK/SrfK